MSDNKINVGGRLHSIATGNVLVGADEIFDDDKNKKQSDINTETYVLVNEVNEKLATLSPEQQSALAVATKANKNEANLGYYVCDTESNIAVKVVANATGYILEAGGSIKIKMNNANTTDNVTLNINSTGAKPLYYCGEIASATNTWEDGETVEVYYDGINFYANNIAGCSNFATGEKIKNVGIDNEPTAGSNNLVKSGGVQNELALGAVYDVSAKNPTAGPNNDGKWESLSALLTDVNLNTLIPTAVRKGGMSIKFIQGSVPNSDNIYVQFRYRGTSTADTDFLNTDNWQGVDEEPTAGSIGIASSDGVAKINAELGYLNADVLLRTDSIVFNANIGDTIHYSFSSNGGSLAFFSGETAVNTLTEGTGTFVTKNKITSVKALYANINNLLVYKEDYDSKSNDDQLKTDITKADTDIKSLKEGNRKVVTSSEYIKTHKVINGTVGSIVSEGNTGYNTNGYVKHNVYKGEVLQITNTGLQGSSKAYYLTDTEGIILTISDDSLINNEIVTISQDGFVYVNIGTQTNYNVISDISYLWKSEVDPLKVQVQNNNSGIVEINVRLSNTYSSEFVQSSRYVTGTIGSTIQVKNSSYSSNAYVKRLVKKDEGFYLTNTGITGNPPGYVFTDSSDNVLSIDTATALNKKYVKATQDGFLYVNIGNQTQYAVITKAATEAPEIAKIPIIEIKTEELEVCAAKTNGNSGSIPFTKADFEMGSINANGIEISGNSSMRSIIKEIMPETSCTWTITGFIVYFAFYDYYGTFINRVEGAGEYQTIPKYAKWVRAVLTDANYSIITIDDFDRSNFTFSVSALPRMISAASIETVYKIDKINSKLNRQYQIFAPEQKPANGSADSDFNAETLTPDILYAAYDALLASLPRPSGFVQDSSYSQMIPTTSSKFMVKHNKEAFDASGDYKLRTYVISRKNRYAWKRTDKLYAWKDGSDNIVYIDSCSPRIGDTIYSDVNRTDSNKTVASYNSTTQSFTDSSNVVFSRYTTANVDADIIYIRDIKPTNDFTTLSRVYNREGSHIGFGTLSDATHFTYDSKEYERFESGDYHTNQKGTVFLWANEHAPMSDPNEGAIILYRLAKDLVAGGCKDNWFLKFLRDYTKVVIIPVGNPYGMAKYVESGREGRTNANGVNINRNYDTVGWAVQSSDPSSGDYKGVYAGDQNETNYIMNILNEFDADVSIDIHCLGIVRQVSEGKCHFEGLVTETAQNNLILEIMESYGLTYSSYGDADPATTAQGPSYIRQLGKAGGLIEMNAGNPTTVDNYQHTAHLLEADYTLLLNNIYLRWLEAGFDRPENII